MKTYTYNDKHDSVTKYVQDQLEGRTFYVNPDTLKFHKSRIVYGCPMCDGLLFGLVESIPDSTGKRKFRAVVFDIFGKILEKSDLYTHKEKGAKYAMFEIANKLDAVELTRIAAKKWIEQRQNEYASLLELVNVIEKQ